LETQALDHSVQLVVLGFQVGVFDISDDGFENEGAKVRRSREGEEGEQSFQ
jgi:hypothetical protein